jgi:hypothetical protein
MKLFYILFFVFAIVGGATQTQAGENNKLAVVWTSGDPDVAHRMVLMYTHAAKTAGWFDEVVLIIWGPSQCLYAGDMDIQNKVLEMKEDEVRVEACVVCSDSYGITERLRETGLTVKPMRKPLSEMIKGDRKVVTF